MGALTVRDTLKSLGLAASKSRGQNFLKDGNQIRRLVETIIREAGPQARLLEIGPGLGALTAPLLAAGASITAVELDWGLAEHLGSLASLYPGRLKIRRQDILTLDPAEEADSEPLFVCGNLPYNISSPLLFWFLNHRAHFSGACLMLQKELAQRLSAEAGRKAYGRLAAALSLWCQVRQVFELPPDSFFPRPRVDSAVIVLRPWPKPKVADLDPETFGRFTAAAFAARRKTILNNLIPAYGRQAALTALAAEQVEPGLRAEVLRPELLASLALRLEAGRKKD